MICALGTAAVWPLLAMAQQPEKKTRRLAILHPSALVAEMTGDGNHPGFVPFFAELKRLGYIEGENLVIDRYASLGDFSTHEELAQRAVVSGSEVIFTVGGPALLKLKAATDKIPIVGIFGDPVAMGIVINLARPGGNITGSSVDAGIGIWTKRLELLKEVAPQISRVGFLTEKSRMPVYADALGQAATRLSVEFIGAPLVSPMVASEYKRVFDELVQQRADGVIVSDLTENFANRAVILDLVGAMRVPAIYPIREYAPLGGLMSFGSDPADFWRRAAIQIHQIFKGAKPGDIPIFQPTRFTLTFNMKTAMSLGLSVPASFLARVDEVIE